MLKWHTATIYPQGAQFLLHFHNHFSDVISDYQADVLIKAQSFVFNALRSLFYNFHNNIPNKTQ